MLKERDTETAALAKAAKAAAKAKAKAAPPATAALEDADSGMATVAESKETETVAKSKGKKGKLQSFVGTAKSKGVEFEKTRSQYLARTGLAGKGQTRGFRFGGKHATFSSQEAAKNAAYEWLATITA